MAIASTLAPDVLSEIFDHAVLLANDTVSLREAPLNISHTCHSWRNVALSQRQYWTCITYNTRAHPRLALLWVQRSANALLDITAAHYQSHVMSKLENDSDVELLLQMLQHKQSQWRRIDLVTDSPLCPVRLRDLSHLNEFRTRAQFPFGVVGVDDGVPRANSPVFVVPQLANVAGSIPIAPSLTTFDCTVNWSFEARRGLLAMLRHAPNLEDLEFHIRDEMRHGRREREDVEEPMFTLSRLKNLEISDCLSTPGPRAPSPFRFLVAPSLQSLTIFASSQMLFVTILEILTRADQGASLRSAFFWYYEEWDDVDRDVGRSGRLLRLFELLAHVTHLKLNINRENAALEMLYLAIEDAESGEGLLLNLERLELFAYPGYEIDLLVDALASRLRWRATFTAKLVMEATPRADRNYFLSFVDIVELMPTGRLELEWHPRESDHGSDHSSQSLSHLDDSDSSSNQTDDESQSDV